ncbi:hypothetical protein [Dictyobacter kobayashii]|uniref:Uncharacterized protein n=1 Tax=Dictyobacter kobayashii TaxID=2014872 RepID=A0A402AC30_9CHLR|nr:hypothetical protein [Dictyobacter kobayashii]GCE16641.1 hypothetical protein KDK_04410 [Dictyobacter kobayashii]
MFSSEEISQTTGALENLPEALEKLSQTTDALEKLPRTFDHRSALNEGRQQILQQKQSDKNTDTLPPLGAEAPAVKISWRQMVQLREENQRLRATLDELQGTMQQLSDEKTQLQARFEAEIAVIHSGHQQDIAHYQTHLLELMDERNRLYDEYSALNVVQQDFAQRFERSVDEEIQQRLEALAQVLDTSDAGFELPDALQRFVQTVGLQARSDGDRYLAEVVHLKREVERMAESLDKERQRLDDERRQLITLQQSASEQAQLRQKTLDARFRARWKAISLSTSAGLLLLLIVLQFVCMALFHIPLAGTVTLALLMPILFCALIAIIMASPPVQILKYVRDSVPRRKKIMAS